MGLGFIKRKCAVVRGQGAGGSAVSVEWGVGERKDGGRRTEDRGRRVGGLFDVFASGYWGGAGGGEGFGGWGGFKVFGV